MTAITIILGRPAIDSIPRTDKTQIRSKTPAICLKGDGSIPIAQAMAVKMNRSQRVITLPLMLKSGTLKLESPCIFA